MIVEKKRKYQQHICEICNKAYKGAGIVHHLRKVHHIESEEYYLFVMKQVKGSCLECGIETSFVNVFRGYLDFCGDSCKSKYFWRTLDNTKRCRNIGRSMLGNTNGTGNEGRISPMRGRKHREESKRKIGEANSIALKGNIPWNKDKYFVEREMRICAFKECNNQFECLITEGRKYCSTRCFTADHSGDRNPAKDPRVREKISLKATIRRKLGLKRKKCSEQDTLRRMRSTLKAQHIKPNRPETFLLRLLQKLFPDEYKYVGDGEIWFGGKNPDFLNVNGQKKIIEMFGDYWHSEEVTGVSEEQHIHERKNGFRKYGYQTLIIWEHELENVKKISNRVLEFNKI